MGQNKEQSSYKPIYGNTYFTNYPPFGLLLLNNFYLWKGSIELKFYTEFINAKT